MSILVLNAGSSSLKSSLFLGDLRIAANAHIDWQNRPGAVLKFQRAGEEEQSSRIQSSDFRDGLQIIMSALDESGQGAAKRSIVAVGHRVVHGGTAFRRSIRLDEQVKKKIRELSELAPLHNPPALETIEAAEQLLTDVPQVAVFDTAFHATLKSDAYLYPLPYRWYEQWGVRRFGFHGISHQYCTRRAAEMLGFSEDAVNLVVCHLGNGCSATAVRNGKSVATTMGFTPLEGLMMGSRAGSVDPGLLLYLQRNKGIKPEQMEHILNKESGLLGISGMSSDMRSVQEAARQGNERAQLALDMFTGRVRSAIGSLAVYLDRLDALVFTAGIGEHSPSIRESVCEGLKCLGISLDPKRNVDAGVDEDVGTANSAARIFVIHTNEEWMIANETRRVLGL